MSLTQLRVKTVTHLKTKGGLPVARMFRVLAYISLVAALLAFWGNLIPMSLIFFGQTAVFVALSYLSLSERTYLLIFNAYMVVFFVTFMYYIFFAIPLTGPTAQG